MSLAPRIPLGDETSVATQLAGMISSRRLSTLGHPNDMSLVKDYPTKGAMILRRTPLNETLEDTFRYRYFPPSNDDHVLSEAA